MAARFPVQLQGSRFRQWLSLWESWRGAPERARPLAVKPQRLPVPARSSPLFEAERAERSQQKAPPTFAGGALSFIQNTDAPP